MTIEAIFTLVISAAALVVSVATAWTTLFRRGTVRMTRPTVIYFGRDERSGDKVFLRALLFSTGQRGCVVESMYVLLARNNRQQAFNIWVYGSKEYVRGSGIFVGESGVEANHHFLLPDGANFEFEEGRYHVEVYANFLGRTRHHLLFSCDLDVTRTQATELKKPHVGLYFDWLPDQMRYAPHVDRRRPRPTLADALMPTDLLQEPER